MEKSECKVLLFFPLWKHQQAMMVRQCYPEIQHEVPGAAQPHSGAG